MGLCRVQVHTESEALDPLELKPQVVVKTPSDVSAGNPATDLCKSNAHS